MEIDKTELERAFELARSGNYKDVDGLIRRLKSEGYPGNQVEGKSLRIQLAFPIFCTSRNERLLFGAASS